MRIFVFFAVLLFIGCAQRPMKSKNIVSTTSLTAKEIGVSEAYYQLITENWFYNKRTKTYAANSIFSLYFQGELILAMRNISQQQSTWLFGKPDFEDEGQLIYLHVNPFDLNRVTADFPAFTLDTFKDGKNKIRIFDIRNSNYLQFYERKYNFESLYKQQEAERIKLNFTYPIGQPSYHGAIYDSVGQSKVNQFYIKRMLQNFDEKFFFNKKAGHFVMIQGSCYAFFLLRDKKQILKILGKPSEHQADALVYYLSRPYNASGEMVRQQLAFRADSTKTNWLPTTEVRRIEN